MEGFRSQRIWGLLSVLAEVKVTSSMVHSARPQIPGAWSPASHVA
jgi:hypothetical protein